jgi:hypothetical protein
VGSAFLAARWNACARPTRLTRNRKTVSSTAAVVPSERPMPWFNSVAGATARAPSCDALVLAVAAVLSRLPACGGVILWMGHDCFPCTSNASILDFDGEPKPVANARERVIGGGRRV